MQKPILWISLLIGLIFALSAFYIVDQRKQALVLEFGKPVAVKQEAGLYFKVPFIQEVQYFDKRIINFDAQDKEVLDSEQKRLTVNAFAKYIITDPLKFYQTVNNERGINDRLDKIFEASLRDAIGSILLTKLLTEERVAIMRRIKDAVREKAKSFGIEVLDVRIVRADLPEENSNAIYKRMRAERLKEAKEFRAEGAEEAQRITSRADKERRILLAEARKRSQIIRGQGDAEATRIFAKAFGNERKSFFKFYRTMQAYQKSFQNNDTTMVISPDSEFLKYFSTMNGGRKN